MDDILATDLDYWIGLTDLASEGKLNTSRKNKTKTIRCAAGVWRWQESRTEAEYVNWDQREPNNSGIEDCVEKRATSYQLWNDTPCESRVPFALCQVEE